MKLRICFKDPDAVWDSIGEFDLLGKDLMKKLKPKEQTEIYNARLEEVKTKLEKWLKYNEYITVEFDLDKMTAKVLEV